MENDYQYQPHDELVVTSSSSSSSYSYVWMILLGIFVLSLIGVNVFQYLATTTQEIDNIFGPGLTSVVKFVVAICAKLFVGILEAIRWVFDTIAHAVDTIVNGTESVVSSAASSAASGAASGAASSAASGIPPQGNAAVVMAHPESSSQQPEPEASQANQGRTSGWCYIGEENNFGICTQVGPKDSCLSGQIFPTQDLCINPTLRA
jgi:hypothetical protein